MEIFGDTLSLKGDLIEYSALQRILKRSYIKPRFKINVLNADETVNYTIPEEDILNDGISFTENYQNGQRKNITLKLINIQGKYTPSINGIWLSTKFSFEIGLNYSGDKTVWFPRGVYIMGDVTLTHENSRDEISIQLKDKYAIFEGKMGTLDEAYEIPVGSNIEDAINGIRNFSLGNGYILDYKPIILDPSFVGKTTQSTIRIEEGQNLGKVIDELATQLSAEYYYNNVGNLCFYPLNETVDDSNKPVIWVFEDLGRSLHNLTLTYNNEEIINDVKVVGDNIENGIFSATVTNENPTSPICIERVGRRVAPKYTEANVWNDELAYDMAIYYLRQYSFASVNFSCVVGFNPILAVNNICEVENSHLELYREKLLITSISYTSSDGAMTLSLCNTSDLPTLNS